MHRRRFLTGLTATALAPVALIPPRARAQDPAPVPTPPLPAWRSDPTPIVSFVINVQDFRYPDTSAQTVGRLCTILAKHRVRGDFYLTAPVLHLYAERGHADVVEALKAQGLSYHVRPPHPLFHPFDARLAGLGRAELETLLRDYERFRLDLSTGELDREQAGGFVHVRDTLGRPPGCVGMPNPDPTVRQVAARLYGELGATGIVATKREQSPDDPPLVRRLGLVDRPADIVLDRWKASGQTELWWNRQRTTTARGEERPEVHLESRLKSWSGSRAPFVQLKVHDDNFTRWGPDSWRETYWADRRKTTPKSPPFDLAAPDPSTARSKSEQQRIFDAFEATVAHCAERYRVMPMEEIAAMGGVVDKG